MLEIGRDNTRFHSVRIRFERRYGPVARQITEWMSE